MVDVAHDGHDWGARLQVGIVIGVTAKADFDVCFRDALNGVAKLGRDEFCGVGVNDVVAAQHLALLDHELHNVGNALVHAACEVLQGDRFRQRDFDGNFLAAVGAAHLAFTLALTGAADGGQGTLAVSVVAKRGSDGQLALAACTRIAAARSGFAGTVTGAVVLDDLTAALAAAGIIILNRHCGCGRCRFGARTGLDGAINHGFARRRFGGLAGFFLGLPAGFGLFAFAAF